LSLTSASCYPIHHDGPYTGKVVDAETGKAIEGVVVLGVWYEEIATAAGGVGSYYDAKETVTDKDGEFEIQGVKRKIFTYIGQMNVLIFKAGYEYVGSYEWDTLKVDPRKIRWEGGEPIIPLRKLTVEERKRSLGPPDPPSEAPFEKVQLMLRELDKDSVEQGLPKRGLWNGVHYD
jgi:hypothetical protein